MESGFDSDNSLSSDPYENQANFNEESSLTEDKKLEFENIETEISSFLIQNSSVKNFTPAKITPFLKSFELVLKQNIRGLYTTDELLIEKVQSIGSFSSLCGKLVPWGELFFCCFDCDLVSKKEMTNLGNTLQCKQCFEKANHEGHKVSTRLPTAVAVCDCGDPAVWDKNGFCPSHQGFSSEKALKMIAQIPSDIEKTYISTFSELFYLIFRLIEDNKLAYLEIQSYFIHVVGLNLLDLCSKGDGFKLLTCKLMKSKLSEKWLFKHNCDDLETLSLRELKGPCKCTILELLFRFDSFLNESCQAILKDLFLDLFVNHEFRLYFTAIYTKMIYFSYVAEAPGQKIQRTQDNILQDPIWELKDLECTKSSISGLNLQILMTDELSLAAVNSGYFHQLFDLLRKLLHCTGIKQQLNNVYSIFYSASSNFVYIFALSTTSKAILQKPETLESIFAILMDVQNTDRFHLHEFIANITVGRYAEYLRTRALLCNRILEITSALMVHLFQIEDDTIKKKIMSNFSALFASNYKKCKGGNQDSPLFNQGRITMNPILFHSFGIFISYLIVEDPDLNFNNQEFQILWEDALYESLKSLIFFKILFNAPENVPSLRPLKTLLYHFYLYHFSSGSPFSDYEVLLAQTSFLMLKDKTRVKTVMKNLLSYTENENDPNSAALELVWKSTCFEVFTFVMRDEVSYALVHKRQLKNYFKAANRMKPLFDEIAKKMIVNYLHIFPSQKFEEINSGLASCTSIKNDQHVLDSIVNVSEQTKKLRLKTEWQNRGLEPQIFFKDESLDQPLQTLFKDIFAKSANFNILLGCPEPFSLPYLADVEKTASLWILSDLEMFYDIVSRLLEGKVDVVGALRFISICVKVLEKSTYKELALVLDLATLKVLREVIEKLVLKLKPAKGLEDYASALAQLIILMERIEKKITARTDVEESINEERKVEDNSQVNAESEDKRNKLLEKQREIKERFIKKQQEFLAKSKNTSSENIDSPTKSPDNVEKRSIICNYCHETIKPETEKHGYLAFMTRSNFPDYCRLYKAELEARAKDPKDSARYSLWQILNLSSQVEAAGCFTISSCHHYMHNNCFELFQSNRVLKLDKMNAPNEFFCIFCKALCNAFIPASLESKLENKNSNSLAIQNFSLNFLANAIITIDPNEFFKGLGVTEAKPTDDDSNVFGDQLFIINLTIAERLGLNEFADQPEDVVRTMILEYAELIEAISLQRFYNSKAHLLKACSTLTRNLYWNQLTQYEGVLSDKVLKLKKDISRLMLNDANSSEEALEFAKDFVFEPKHSIQSILEVIWNMYFVERFLMQSLSTLVATVVLYGSVLELLKLFIEEKLLEAPESLTEPVKHSTVDIFKQYLIEDIDTDFPALLTYLRKVVAVTSSIGCFNLNSDYKDLLKGSQILSMTLGLENSKLTIKEILSQFITSNEKTFEFIFKGISEYVRRKAHTKEIKILPNCLKGSDIAIFPFPEDYQGFRALFQKQKCHLCNEFPLAGRGVVCLICGKFMCVSLCKERKRRQMSGNLNEHARERHCGVTAFVDTELSFVYLLNSPKNAVFRHVYQDKYGQSIDRLNQNLEWRDFKLNEQVMNEIKNLIIENQIPQKICRLIDEDKGRLGDNQL